MQNESRYEAQIDDETNKPPEVVANGDQNKGLPIRSIYLGIFLTSAGVLLLEISLTRIFSYTIWYHFTYVTISLAMLGFGASGAILAASEKLARLDIRLAHRSSLIGAISVPIMLAIISKVPFYPFQLFKEPVQFAYMVLYYVAVTLPFFCAGMTISCAFRSMPQRATRIYFWDLVGAGMGCFVIVAAIHALGVPKVAALSASLFLLAAAMFLTHGSALVRLSIAVAAVLWIPIALNVEKALEFKASKEKWVSRHGIKEFEFSKWSPIFRVDVYRATNPILAPDGSFFGIRKRYLSNDIQSVSIAHDGDACTAMIRSDENMSAFSVFEKSILKPPYLLVDNPRVLVIGPGGGVDVGMALQSKARSVLAVELDPITVDLVTHKYADFAGHLYSQPEVGVVVDEGRSFLRRTNEEFDLIQMTQVDTLAALSSGAYVLAENYLYTIEAYEDFMKKLTADGILSITTLDYHYKAMTPRHTMRHLSLSIEALKKRGIDNPASHIAVIAASRGDISIPHITIITKMSPFTSSQVSRLRRFADRLPFDIWHLPGEPPDNPCAHILVSADEQREEYYKEHPLKLVAPTDNSPFFFYFYRWKNMLKWDYIDKHRTISMGQLILLLILMISILFSIVLIIFPLFTFQRIGLQTRRKWNYILYFAALGLGFIFIEISYIQRFILFLGYPTYSLTVILFSLLTFSGIGSYLSGRLPFRPSTLLIVALALLSGVALGYMVILPPVFNHFLAASKQVRIAISLVLLFPLGSLLGMFFPTGIKIISTEDRHFVPWAWGINGCASVIGTVLSIIIAMTYGFSTVTVLAVIIYVVGVLAMAIAHRKEPDLSI